MTTTDQKDKDISDLRAALDVYAFTLEFLLVVNGLCDESAPAIGEDIVNNQIQAARDAYKEVTGQDPTELIRSRPPTT